MPLLHKQQFKQNPPSSTLQPEDKVFYCELTNEVFTDYDEFWERLVLCNAMVWTCEMTGRNNLTYEEALESESKAKKCLSKISPALHKPLLYLTSLTRRGKYSDMNDDVFNFVRDRYFYNEEVEAIVNKHWYDSKVVGIIVPSLEEVARYELDMADSDDEENENEENVKDNDSDIMIIEDVKPSDEIKKPKKEKVNSATIAEKMTQINIEAEDYPPYATIKYEIEELEPWDYKSCQTHIVTWEQIRRNKCGFTREKLKLYLKQCVVTDFQGYWTLKKSVVQKYKTDGIKFSEIFVGNCPKFIQSKAKKAVIGSAESLEKVVKINSKEKKEIKVRERKENREEKKKNNIEEKKKTTEEKKKNTEEMKLARKLQKDSEKQERQDTRDKLREELRHKKTLETKIKREEKRLLNMCVKKWTVIREDLDCDDNKNLPVGTPVQCRIPNHLFGEYMSVLEFLSAFSDTLELKDVYPLGVNFDLLEHALIEKEIAGLFNDLLQLLLGAIFNLQEQEDDEIADAIAIDIQTIDEKEYKDPVRLKAVQNANHASRWTQRHQGETLQKVPLDALTLSEILRLHLLASGATNVANSMWRHNNRGGFKIWDDPGMQLKLDDPDLIASLNERSVFDLTIGEKLKVLSVLMNQILTYASVRDIIDDNMEKVREVRNEIKLHKYAESRQEKEDNAAIKLKQKEDKQRKIDHMIKNMELKSEGVPIIEIEEQDKEQQRLEQEAEEKNRERKKQDFARKEQDLVTQLQNISKNVNMNYLGQDRAYRTYWVFDSLDGLFIEDVKDHPGSCRSEPTPTVAGVNPLTSEVFMEKIKIRAVQNVEEIERQEKEEKSASDKENEVSNGPNMSDNNSTMSKLKKDDAVKFNDTNFKNQLDDNLDFFLSPTINGDVTESESKDDIFDLCTADPSTCSIHGDVDTKKDTNNTWLFYSETIDLDNLIEALNARGARESQLKEALINNKINIEGSLNKCPAFKLDPTKDPETDKSLRKSLRGNKKDGDSNLNFPIGTAIDEIFESTIRDLILEVEEKVNMGFLGSLKVPDNEVWRTSVAEGLAVAAIRDMDWGGRSRINKLREQHNLDPLNDADYTITVDGITGAKVSSRPKKIINLELAILQLSQAVDVKYLKPPLGESDKLQAKRLRAENKLIKMSSKKQGEKDQESDSESDSDDEDIEINKSINNQTDLLRTPMERWERSLMSSTSLSQLFLHLATLDNSITWSRSALNARCRICRRKGDPDNMLLCDGCNKGHHMYCLKPKLKSIPTGDWFCDTCRPKNKPKSPQKKRRIYKEISEDEESEEETEQDEDSNEDSEECELCNKNNADLRCGDCSRVYHFECADLRKLPRGHWSCSLCKSSPPKSKGKQSPTGGNKKKATGTSNSQSKKRKPAPSEEERPAKRQRHEPEEVPTRTSRRSILVDEHSRVNAGAQETLLQELSSHEWGWPFLKPVSKKMVPDYYNVVKKPMDFRTVHNKMNSMKYKTDSEFIADVLLVFQNCQQYNLESTTEYKCGIKLCKYFRKRVKELGLHYGHLLLNGVGS